ncbi:hypothetical protein MCUN1_001040 [Malassezia cuniculi]|uniref:Acyl-CoA thioesterase II n=1 Tax=Malassezia cuniculi TaxID=948313 RepID=A0AAF0EP13_9BASI|nr:hypothetical protein MCUN1_001040 [Malassezia cuniculi]
MTDHDFAKLIGVKATSDPWVFESISNPGRAGNQLPIAYGGCACGVAVVAAGQTVDLTKGRFVPYSVTGYFLGPASLDTHFLCYVTPLRDTRSFITRHVVLKQQTPKGLRSCFVLTIDFVASPNSTPEALDAAKKKGVDPSTVRSLFNYQSDPKLKFVDPESLSHPNDVLARRLKDGEVDEMTVAMQNEFLGLWHQYFDSRSPEESILAQNVMGLLDVSTSQDSLPILERRAADWFRPHQELPPVDGREHLVERKELGMLPISSTILHAAIAIFALDGVLAFAPVSINNRMMMETSSASSLDFALRFHTDLLDISGWHLREVRTISSGWSRTYNEANLWDRSGRLIATETQQCVLHPAKNKL